jgi:tight adherence protein C
MGLALFSFIAVFLLIGSAGLLLFYRAAMLERLSTVISPRSEGDTWLNRLKTRGAERTLKAVVQPFDKVIPKSTEEVSVAQKRLIRAGYREDSDVRIFYGAKVLIPLWLCILVGATGLTSYFGAFFVYALTLALGYLFPDFWVGHRIKARQLNIRLGLPEFLDLMVVCIEAGLSLDQALSRSADEMRASQPEISDEMGLMILEQRAGSPRAQAWKHLADRVDIDVMRTLVSAVVQADQFGTSIAKTLRVYSDQLRTQRRQNVEEMAAKMAVKIVFPLVLFIFPSLFIVAMGPAIIILGDSFQKFFQG